MRGLKGKKGITLVALVITIIILLILAGITISQLTGSGLFENAKLAEEKSKNSQEKEEGILEGYENKIGAYIDSTRETITVDKQQYEQLLNDVKQLKERVNSSMTWTKLGQTSATTETNVAIENIDNYKYVVVAVQGNSSKNMYTSVLIPVETFKHETTGNWTVYTDKYGYAKYVSNESVTMCVSNNAITVILYGVK